MVVIFIKICITFKREPVTKIILRKLIKLNMTNKFGFSKLIVKLYYNYLIKTFSNIEKKSILIF